MIQEYDRASRSMNPLYAEAPVNVARSSLYTVGRARFNCSQVQKCTIPTGYAVSRVTAHRRSAHRVGCALPTGHDSTGNKHDCAPCWLDTVTVESTGHRGNRAPNRLYITNWARSAERRYRFDCALLQKCIECNWTRFLNYQRRSI